MPVLTIYYTILEHRHAISEEIEWVSPSGWTIDQSIESFKLKHPTANITGFDEFTNAKRSSSMNEIIQLSGRLTADRLLAIRRPKKPTKKELALEAIERINSCAVFNMKSYEIYDVLKNDINYLYSIVNDIPDDENSNE